MKRVKLSNIDGSIVANEETLNHLIIVYHKAMCWYREHGLDVLADECYETICNIENQWVVI